MNFGIVDLFSLFLCIYQGFQVFSLLSTLIYFTYIYPPNPHSFFLKEEWDGEYCGIRQWK